MDPTSIVDVNAGLSTGGIGYGNFSKIDTSGSGFADTTRFQDAMSSFKPAAAAAVEPAQAGEGVSLGQKMFGRAAGLADNLKSDQQHVSKMLENATRTGDSMQLMKAMMALNDYQIKVQTISKTVSKATSALDQLTKLQ